MQKVISVLNDIMLTDFLLSVVMLNVVAPNSDTFSREY